MEPIYLSIEQKETGKHIKRLLEEHGYTVKDVQSVMGFENPQAIYKWLSGRSLPSLDNFLILSRLLHTSIEDILVLDGDICILIQKSFLHLMRGQVFEIDGKKIFTFGGASSHDKWFFGHYHDNINVNEKEILIYEQMLRIV